MAVCGRRGPWAIALLFAAWAALVTIFYFAQFMRLAEGIRRLRL